MLQSHLDYVLFAMISWPASIQDLPVCKYALSYQYWRWCLGACPRTSEVFQGNQADRYLWQAIASTSFCPLHIFNYSLIAEIFLFSQMWRFNGSNWTINILSVMQMGSLWKWSFVVLKYQKINYCNLEPFYQG